MQTDGDHNIQERPQVPGAGELEIPGVGARGAAPAQDVQSDKLHVCFHCSGELAYPLDWCEEGPRHWRIVLRCPDCESLREGVFEQSAVESLDDELDRGASALLADLKRITHANMTDEIDFFVRALDADLIVPSDF
ncbi:MAG TPA: hypothetical protein VG010_01775 [Solirubrobacteraceae bacterium]|jgi:hypothetical protein|nr:hypothetical protein [Solirubrobacteraceae bacterium]